MTGLSRRFESRRSRRKNPANQRLRLANLPQTTAGFPNRSRARPARQSRTRSGHVKALLIDMFCDPGKGPKPSVIPRRSRKRMASSTAGRRTARAVDAFHANETLVARLRPHGRGVRQDRLHRRGRRPRARPHRPASCSTPPSSERYSCPRSCPSSAAGTGRCPSPSDDYCACRRSRTRRRRSRSL